MLKPLIGWLCGLELWGGWGGKCLWYVDFVFVCVNMNVVYGCWVFFFRVGHTTVKWLSFAWHGGGDTWALRRPMFHPVILLGNTDITCTATG